MGTFAEGIVVAEAAIQIAEAVEQPYSIVVTLNGVVFLYRRQGDLRPAFPLLQLLLTCTVLWR